LHGQMELEPLDAVKANDYQCESDSLPYNIPPDYRLSSSAH